MAKKIVTTVSCAINDMMMVSCYIYYYDWQAASGGVMMRLRIADGASDAEIEA